MDNGVSLKQDREYQCQDSRGQSRGTMPSSQPCVASYSGTSLTTGHGALDSGSRTPKGHTHAMDSAL